MYCPSESDYSDTPQTYTNQSVAMYDSDLSQESYEPYDAPDPMYDSYAYPSQNSHGTSDASEEEPILTIEQPQPPNHTNTYNIHIFGYLVRTTVTYNPAKVRDWLKKVLNIHRSRRHKLVVGLGVQWKPSSRAYPSRIAATLQLCIGSQCLIFQLLYANSVPHALRRFLNDPRNAFVGVWNYNDASLLLRSCHSLEVSRIVDIRDVAAAWRGLNRQIPMEKLAEHVLGYVVDVGALKPELTGRSDWDARLLSEEQVQYAGVDAFVSFLLGKELQVWEWNN